MALPTDDWLLHNASEYTINGKTYRNLEAQVLKNKRDIEEIQQGGIELPIVQEINEESTADTIPSAKAVFDDVLSYAEAIADDVVDLQGDLSNLDGRALKVPITAPTEKRMVGVDTANSQIMVNVGNTLKLDGTTSPYTLNVKNPVSGNYSGDNWANITINGVTKNIPSGGSGETSPFCFELWNEGSTQTSFKWPEWWNIANTQIADEIFDAYDKYGSVMLRFHATYNEVYMFSTYYLGGDKIGSLYFIGFRTTGTSNSFTKDGFFKARLPRSGSDHTKVIIEGHNQYLISSDSWDDASNGIVPTSLAVKEYVADELSNVQTMTFVADDDTETVLNVICEAGE
ncbi:MAG: hypothetical protein KBS62_03470 [Oscillospiraceae bacterium]|nr:hypothetical protein [Candidatus Ruminococcus equi]